MRLFDTLLAVLGALGLLALAAWSYLDFPKRAKGYEDTIRSAVKTHMINEGLAWVSVDVDGQAARLSGVSGGGDNEARAMAAAMASLGQGGPIFGAVTMVEAEFEPVAVVSPFVWRTTLTSDGTLVFGGNVPNRTVRAALVAAAEDAGVATVEDRTEIAAGAPPGAWTEVATVAVASVAELEMGTAVLRNTRLRVTGIARDNARRSQLSAEVLNVPPPYSGQSEIRGPSVWSARHADGVLVLEGGVANEAERQAFLDIASTHFSSSVVDEMDVVAETREGLSELVQLGLPHFARFETGFMGFDPEGVGLVVAGKAGGGTLNALREDMARADGPYGVVIDTIEIEVVEQSEQ
ncbi:MAG: hypothetical protein AAF829_11585 [Pseudomonadota bacterium]